VRIRWGSWVGTQTVVWSFRVQELAIRYSRSSAYLWSMMDSFSINNRMNVSDIFEEEINQMVDEIVRLKNGIRGEPVDALDDPWNDDVVLVARAKSLAESVMIDEITTNVRWNISDADMDKKLNVVKMKSLEFFGDINSTFSVYGKVEKEYSDRLKKYKLYLYDKNAECLVGYANVLSDRQRRRRMTIHEIALRPSYRGKNIAYDFYLMLLRSGYTVVSDGQQTKGGASVWKILMSDSKVKVTAIDSSQKKKIHPADAWNHPHARLEAKMISESIMVDEIEQMEGEWGGDTGYDIKSRVRRYLPDAKPFGKIDNLTIKLAVDRKFSYFIFYDKRKIVGFAELSTHGIGAHEVEIALSPEYQRRGIGYKFYKMALDHGYKLVSGLHQYKGAEMIWRKLMKDPAVSVSVIWANDIDSPRSTYTVKPVGRIDPWKTKNEYLHLMATKKSINESVVPVSEDDIRNGIRYVVGVPLKVFGKIDDIIISMGQNGDERMFLFSIGGEERQAIGYASATMKKIHIEKKTFTVLNITDLGLYKAFRKRGIGFAFYNMLLEDGYVLISDETQTGEGEGLWRKLIKQPGIGVTTVKATKTKDKFEHIDLVADDPWAMKNVRIILQAGNQEITEGTPRVAAIQPQPKGLSRCTTVSCNAIFSHFKTKLITSNVEVPQTAKDCFERIRQRGLKILPDVMSPQKKVPLNIFANTHRNGVWLVGTKGHSMCLIDGELFDAENKGLDSRPVLIAAQIKI
jgi:GNAT superfamily N-acetyltransferase